MFFLIKHLYSIQWDTFLSRVNRHSPPHSYSKVHHSVTIGSTMEILGGVS